MGKRNINILLLLLLSYFGYSQNNSIPLRHMVYAQSGDYLIVTDSNGRQQYIHKDSIIRDTSITNEPQTLSISNDTLTISSGNSVALPKRYNYINGLTLLSDTVKLGGNLIQNTDIGGNFLLRRDISLNNSAALIINNSGTTSTGIQSTGTSTGVSSTGSTRGVQANSGTWPIVANNSSTSNTVTTGVRLTREATFTSSIGHGIRLEYAGRSSTGATVNIASIDAVATRVTQDSMTGWFDFTNRNNGTNQTNMQIFGNGSLKYNNYGSGTFTGTASKWLAVTSSGDVIEMNDPTAGATVDTATFLQQDSILIYSVAGVEFGRDTIRTAGAGGDNWGSQVVISDTTLVGDGTALNPLGVDTTQIATHYYISEGFTTKYIDFDTTYANNYAEGRMKWNVDENSVEIGLSANLSGTALIDDYWYVKNQTGSSIAAGQLVYASGTLGTSGRILVTPYIANGTIDAKYVLGVVAETIPDGEDGYVITKGKLKGINTSAWPDGTVLWASTANAGNLTDTVPQAPNFRLPVAFVVHSASNGILAVRVTTGSDLYEDHRVQVGSPSDGQLLRYNSTNQRWENWTPNFALQDTSGRNNYLAISNDTLFVGDDNDTLNVKLTNASVLQIVDITVTTDTVTTSDLGKLLRCNNAGAITLRIDTNANQPLPIGAVITVEQVGAGVVTITPISGVTINPTARKTWGQYSVIQLIKVGTNTWNVVGGID